MVSMLNLLFPRDLFGNSDQQSAMGSAQSAEGKNIQEVSYQEGSKDHINHTERSGFQFIETHQGRVDIVGVMLTYLLAFGVLLCCIRLARNHF